jgi:hypothetical protein
MSDNAPVEQQAFAELESLVHHLAEELAGFRRRALLAESRLKDINEHEEAGVSSADLAARVAQLEGENERLQNRLEAATVRAKQMLDRVKFLRQQAQGSKT